jgi:hypothetical protein
VTPPLAVTYAAPMAHDPENLLDSVDADLPLPVGVAARAARLLCEHTGDEVRVSGYEPIRPDGHAHVARLLLTGAPFASAILKLAHRGENGEFDPTGTDLWSPAARLWNEWAGLAFLSSTTPSPPTPRLLGGDADLGFLLLEDLGPGHSLAHVLLGGSPEQARAALEGYVDVLARIHLTTFGRTPEYDRLRTAFGPPSTMSTLAEHTKGQLFPALAALDDTLALDPDLAAAIGWIDELLAAPAWQAYSPQDCCPDNNQVDDEGTVRLFDLEFGNYRHALLDLAYVRTVMPTCWCVRRLPEGLSDTLVERYRRHLAAAGQGTTGRDPNGPDFGTALDASQAFWALWTLGWHLPAALEPDGAERPRFDEWNFELGSRREIVGQRLTELAAAAVRQPRLAPLVGFAERVRATVRQAWPGIEPLPIYPAFR